MAGTAQPSDVESSDHPTSGRYTFGDSDLAAGRLAVVADVFAASSRRFITRAAPDSTGVAVDLGCGPGFTTHLVAQASGASHTTGLDSSGPFLEIAGRTATATVDFRRHDVTVTPFPVPRADLIYCRFLLTHLAEPVATLTRWTTQLNRGGVLLVDEVERVETTHPVLRRYQAAVTALLSEEGQRLEIGAVLDAAGSPSPVRRVSSEVVVVTPSSVQVGKMFHANLRSWRSDPRLVSRFGTAYLNELEEQLAAVAEGGIAASARWLVRQMWYERR
jgi:trans-aconitate 2-methyltransferase